MIRSIILWLLLVSNAAANPVTITLWHSFAGQLGDEFKSITQEFNHSQQQYVINTVYKGEYTDALTSFAAAFRAGRPPDIIHVFEVGANIMLSPPGIIKPLAELIEEQHANLPIEDFLPAIRQFYTVAGKIQAMPFNVSIPIIYYNAEILKQVGIQRENFPRTWQELEIVVQKLKDEGYSCIYTSSYPAWIHVESFLALHGLTMVHPVNQHWAAFLNTAVLTHLKRLKHWQNQHFFEYGGRANNATILFTSGRCVMFSQSSGSYKSLAALTYFPIGVAPMPLDNKLSNIRYNNVIGGGALWTVVGLTPLKYAGIAAFYTYLAQPEVQDRWHKKTGYIPLGLTGKYQRLTIDTDPILTIAQADLSNPVNPLTAPQIPQNQIRMINDEAMEAIFAGIKTPEIALNKALNNINTALKRFARNTHSV